MSVSSRWEGAELARRNPLNERYQKDTAPAGKTRRSAASAKPKRSSASPAPKPSPSSARGVRKPPPKRQPIVLNPPTAEFARWRRIWWGLLLGATLFTLVSVGIRAWLQQTLLANILLAIGYGGIFAALYVDLTKLRALRRDWMESQKAAASGKKASRKDADAGDEASDGQAARTKSEDGQSAGEGELA